MKRSLTIRARGRQTVPAARAASPSVDGGQFIPSPRAARAAARRPRRVKRSGCSYFRLHALMAAAARTYAENAALACPWQLQPLLTVEA